MKLTEDQIFNNESLNIFTDASVLSSFSCPGYVSIIGDTICDNDTEILMKSTNNNGEIYSIYMGILSALKLRSLYNIKYINLYSDSIISIKGLREWIFNWTESNGYLYGSSGSMIRNQNIFLNIIYTIIDNNLNINLFHIRGHHSNKKDKFIESFKINNHMDIIIDDSIANKLIYYNDIVDNMTRDRLTSNTMEYLNCNSKYFPVSLLYSDFNIYKYKGLILNGF